jgi:hypothetical protein
MCLFSRFATIHISYPFVEMASAAGAQKQGISIPEPPKSRRIAVAPKGAEKRDDKWIKDGKDVTPLDEVPSKTTFVTIMNVAGILCGSFDQSIVRG